MNADDVTSDIELTLDGMPSRLSVEPEVLEALHLPILRTLEQEWRKRRGRFIVLLSGPPGSGKTTLAAMLEALARQGRIDVPVQALSMDGFHFTNARLDAQEITIDGRSMPLRKIKGRPESFDLPALQKKLHAVKAGEQLRWPGYDRNTHDPVPDAVAVISEGIIVVEGLYMLLDAPGWKELRAAADWGIFLECPAEESRAYLLGRKRKQGHSDEHICAHYDLVDFHSWQWVLRKRHGLNQIIRVCRGRRAEIIPADMNKSIDCVVCGSCCADLLVRPVPLLSAIGIGTAIDTEPIRLVTGGLACNAGIALARLHMKTSILAFVGKDEWGDMIRRRLEAEGVDCERLLCHATDGSSASAVLVSPEGERSFAHYEGASAHLDRRAMLSHLDLFARSRMMLVGYYSQISELEPDLPEVLAAIRETGCQTALDSAGSGGALQPLDRILPHLDVYVPSHDEATQQTGQTDPRAIIDTYRCCGAPGILGVKLGAEGALLSPADGDYIEIASIPPPGPVLDTTGAGDAFLAGLLTGLLQGMSVADAGRLGAAAGSCCVTAVGASTGISRDRVTGLFKT